MEKTNAFGPTVDISIQNLVSPSKLVILNRASLIARGEICKLRSVMDQKQRFLGLTQMKYLVL